MSPSNNRGYSTRRRGRNVEKKWTKSVVVVMAAVLGAVLVLAAISPLL